MLYRRFGRTELQMPVFSCGGMRYQQSWKDLGPEEVTKENQENLEATIRRSLEVGIHHIETARGYGTSEMQLGWLLPKLPRENFIIQTKIAPVEDPKEFEKSLNRSLTLLGLETIDLLSLHGINTDELCELSLREDGCLGVLKDYQQKGRIRHIGFSTHAPCQTITKAIESDAFDYVNLHWYYIFQENWPAIEAATRHDMGVFIISPSDKGGLLYKPSPKLVELCQPLSPMAFNDLFCLLRPEVHTLSLGASQPSDFDEHLKALESMDKAPTLIPEISARLQQAIYDEVGPEWADGMLEGIPSWSEIPGNVNVRVILRLWTLAKCLDMIEYGKMRYNILGNADHWFPGENLKDIDPANLAPALTRSPFANIIPARLDEARSLLKAEEKKRLSED